MSDELMHFYLRNMAQLHKETFQDKFGKTLKVLDSGERLRVLLQYLNHANTETHLAFPGVKTLARLTGLDTKNVRAARTDLVRAGWLTPAGSVNYAGVQSQKLPGAAKRGSKNPVSQFLVTMPGMADELPLQGGVPGVVIGGVSGGVTNTPQTKTETEIPPATFANSSGQRPSTRGARKEAKGAAATLAAELVEQDLADRPPKQPAGEGLKRSKAKAFLPLCEEALAFPGAAAHPGAVRRVVMAWSQGNKPDRHDMAALEGEEVRVFTAADLPPVQPKTLDQLPPEVQDMVAANRKRRATAKAG